MGNKHSYRLKTPLVPQVKPVRATRSSIVRPVAASFSVELTGMNTTFRILDANSGQVFHDLEPHEQWGRRTISSTNGVTLATMKPTGGTSFVVYEGRDTHADPRFSIMIDGAPGYPLIVSATFKDVSTGENCRLFVEGHAEDRVVLVCLHRGSHLPSLDKEKNDRNPNAVVVGRIRRPKTDGVVFEGRETMFIEAEAGVDLTLLSMIWWTRYELYFRSVVSAGSDVDSIRNDVVVDGSMTFDVAS